jgi:hypothetical protein
MQSETFNKEERVRVPGGWRTPTQTARMKELWEKLKSVGLFKNFATFEQWGEATYRAKDPEYFQAKKPVKQNGL